jgi:hypothetical protein
MKNLLLPVNKPSGKTTRNGVLLLLLLSAFAVFSAPARMPVGYSWLSNAISESAAQGIDDAWLARLGFVLFGFAVLWLTLHMQSVWGRGAYWFHLAFAVFMISTAAFSHKPWMLNVPYDAFEDLLHSITATGMGFAFAFGVLLRFFERSNNEVGKKFFDFVAILVSFVLPLSGVHWPEIAGLLQRIIFAVAYLWYGKEARDIP